MTRLDHHLTMKRRKGGPLGVSIYDVDNSSDEEAPPEETFHKHARLVSVNGRLTRHHNYLPTERSPQKNQSTTDTNWNLGSTETTVGAEDGAWDPMYEQFLDDSNIGPKPRNRTKSVSQTQQFYGRTITYCLCFYRTGRYACGSMIVRSTSLK